jgi:hypothetical protein
MRLRHDGRGVQHAAARARAFAVGDPCPQMVMNNNLLTQCGQALDVHGRCGAGHELLTA